jgi:hypothetical protein
MADLKIRGTWWFPDNPAKRWTGHLILAKAESPRLEFIVPTNEGVDTPPYPAALFGEDEHGEPVSLLRLRCVNRITTFKVCEVSYEAGHAFFGLHIRDTVDLRINTLAVYVQQLPGWLWRSGFNRSVTDSADGETTIRYRRPPDLRFSVSETLSLELVTCFTSWTHIHERGIREDGCLHFDAPKGIDFREARRLIASIAQILHFASLEPIYPIQVEGTAVPADKTASANFEWTSAWMHNDTKWQIDPDWWVFRFSDVQSDFAQFCARWFDASSLYQEALSCYFTTVYNPLPHSVKHLCLTQALEAYHGIKNAAHHRCFELKIRELANAHRESLPGLFDDPSDFATTVRHNRNYYTHHDPKWLSQGRVAKGSDLFRLNEKLHLLFQACMLQELRIAPDRRSRLRRQLATHIVDYY